MYCFVISKSLSAILIHFLKPPYLFVKPGAQYRMDLYDHVT